MTNGVMALLNYRQSTREHETESQSDNHVLHLVVGRGVMGRCRPPTPGGDTLHEYHDEIHNRVHSNILPDIKQ